MKQATTNDSNKQDDSPMKMDERESKLSPDKVIWEPMWDPKDGDIEKMTGKGIKANETSDKDQ